MGEMSIPSLLLKMSVPAIFSMLVQALYNVVDTIFVSRISGAATTALSLAYPFQMLTLAFALGIGIGSGTAISRLLGEGRPDQADQTAKHGLFLAICASLFFAAAGYFLTKVFISAYVEGGSYDDADAVLNFGIEYLGIVTCLSFGMHLEMFASKTLQATGNMVVPMVAQLIGALTNIILDPIFIFGYFGMPRLEVNGAAIATVIGQVAAMTFSFVMLNRNKKAINISLKGFKPKKEYFGQILKVGIPVTVMNSVASFTTAGMNAILNGLNTIGIAVLGIYFKLQSFIFMPVFGLCQGAMPIMGYNYGARNKKRFQHVFYLTAGVALCIMAAGLLLFQLIPAQLFSIFRSETNQSFYTQLLELGIPAFRIISLAFLPAAFGIVMINTFQSLGRGFSSMAASLFRQVIILLPFSYLMARTVGIGGVWWSYPVAEVITLICFFPIIIRTVNKAFRSDVTLPVSENIPLG